MDDDYRYTSGGRGGGGLDSSRSSPALPLYASPSTAVGGGGGAATSSSSMFPGTYHQSGFAGLGQQRHSFHIPPSYSFDQSRLGGAAGSGHLESGGRGVADWSGHVPAQNTGLGHLGQQHPDGPPATRRSFGSDSYQQQGTRNQPSSAGGSSSIFPFGRGFNLGLHATQSHDSPLMAGQQTSQHDVDARERRDRDWTAGRASASESSSSFLGRSASLGTRAKRDPYAKPRRDDLESGFNDQDAVELDDEGGDEDEVMRRPDAWDDPYAASGFGLPRQQPEPCSTGSGYGSSSAGRGYGNPTIPPPLNTHLAPVGSGSTDPLMTGAASPMSVTMSPNLYATATSSATSASLNGQAGSRRASDQTDPWPQYRQATASTGHMRQQPHQYQSGRYAAGGGSTVIDISQTEQSEDPFSRPHAGQRRDLQGTAPSSMSTMSVDSRVSQASLEYTPSTVMAQNLPYLPVDGLSPSNMPAPPIAYAPHRLPSARSRSSQHLNTSRELQTSQQTQEQGRSQNAQQHGRGFVGNENGFVDKRDRASRPGFRRVTSNDPTGGLRPKALDPTVSGRRADPNVPGGFLSPLKCLTSQLAQTYNICNPSFRYEVAHNPRRVLTKPSKPCHNGGFDNEDYDYILYVNDMLTADNGTSDKYLILDVLGQGTFGQVVKCQNMRTHELVAVKVVKNKPAYLNQSMMEVAILQLLNTEHDKNDEHHLLRMLDHFIHKRHLCLVFECLASNLYELIKHNQFRGLSLQLVKMFTTQLLDALKVLKEARLIHCDLKPENILLKSLHSPQIKIIDFGSACHERQTVYTYIQSRFYRSPEVLLGLPYSSAIDMWSLGCIVVELFLGLPLFPGTSEYNQLSRITEMLGSPPQHLLEVGKQVNEFFNVSYDQDGRKRYRLKPMDQYATEHQTTEQPSKQYFKATQLPEIIKTYPMPKKITKQSDIDKEMTMRSAFIDFVQGLLDMDPITRWSPHQAEKHPFITGERFTGHWEPTSMTASVTSRGTTPANDTRTQQQQQQKKYGGLVSATQNRGQRAYPDAASYNQQLAQHQAYTAQQQAAQAAAQRHPFEDQSMQYGNTQRLQNQAQAQMRQHQTQPRLPSHGNGMQSSMSTGSVYPSQSGIQGPYPPPVANPPPTTYYPTTRNRANTINQMDQIPPALARLTHLGVQDPAGTRSSLTPVLNRDEAIREWERRGHAKKLSINPNNPQLEYLQEQAELAGQAWGGNYGGVQQYPMQPALTSTMDEYQRTNRIGQHRANASSSDFGFPDPSSAAAAQARGLASPRRHHGGGGGSLSNPNYLPAFPPPAASAFDSYDPRGDASLALMYTPLQPNAAGRNQMAASGHRQASSMHHPYGTHNPFAPPGSSGTSPILPQVHLSPGQAQQHAARRASGQYGGGGFGDYEP